MAWEYLILTNTHGELRSDPPVALEGKTLAAVLNTLGGDDWELVGTEPQLILKRKNKRPSRSRSAR